MSFAPKYRYFVTFLHMRIPIKMNNLAILKTKDDVLNVISDMNVSEKKTLKTQTILCDRI